MKFLLLTAALVAMAVAGPTQRLIQAGPAIVDQYEPIHVGPAIVDQYEPIHVGPAIVDQYEPIHVGPAIVDQYEPIHVGPAIVDEYHPIQVGPAIVDEYHPIHVGPAIVDEYQPAHVEPALVDESVVTDVASSGSPLVKIIININPNGQLVSNPEIVQIPAPLPVDIEPTPVIIVDEAEEEKPTPVIVVEEAEQINVVDELPIPPAVIGTPVLPGLPVISQPETLN